MTKKSLIFLINDFRAYFKEKIVKNVKLTIPSKKIKNFSLI
jgi:hypothetical protein